MVPKDVGQNLNEREYSLPPHASPLRQSAYVLTLDEIGNLAAEGGKPAETLMNVVALIAKRFKTDVCSAYLLEPDRANLILTATLGLRPQCVGTLRMALHEGLAGLTGMFSKQLIDKLREIAETLLATGDPIERADLLEEPAAPNTR